MKSSSHEEQEERADGVEREEGTPTSIYASIGSPELRCRYSDCAQNVCRYHWAASRTCATRRVQEAALHDVFATSGGVHEDARRWEEEGNAQETRVRRETRLAKSGHKAHRYMYRVCISPPDFPWQPLLRP